jgi:hypothetical protein
VLLFYLLLGFICCSVVAARLLVLLGFIFSVVGAAWFGRWRCSVVWVGRVIVRRLDK